MLFHMIYGKKKNWWLHVMDVCGCGWIMAELHVVEISGDMWIVIKLHLILGYPMFVGD